MSHSSTTPKKYIIYDNHLEYLKEVVIKKGEDLNNDMKGLLNRSVLFLQYDNTYYYRDVGFLAVG